MERGIHRFKYDGCSYYAPFLGQAVARAVQEQLGEVPFDWVTYVPTSRARLRERGYCQTQLLAWETAARLGLPVKSGILAHTGEGTQQARQRGLRDRQANAEKNFTLAKRPDLTGRRVLLVDDGSRDGTWQLIQRQHPVPVRRAAQRAGGPGVGGGGGLCRAPQGRLPRRGECGIITQSAPAPPAGAGIYGGFWLDAWNGYWNRPGDRYGPGL